MREANPPTWLVVQLRRIPKFLKEDNILSTAPTLNSALKKGRERVSVNRNTLQSSSENIEQAVRQSVSSQRTGSALSVHCSHSLTHSLTVTPHRIFLCFACSCIYIRDYLVFRREVKWENVECQLRK